MASRNLQSIIYTNGDGVGPKLSVLDQLLVPNEKVYVDIPDVEAAWAVIRSMQIRGAPLIAIVACLSVAVDLATKEETIRELDDLPPNDVNPLLSFIQKKTDYLRTSRPTAVNLFNALDELTSVVQNAATSADDDGGSLRDRVVKSLISHAEFMLRRDVSDNEAIGAHGADTLLASKDPDDFDGVRMVTICNTGSLATAGFGTALGVARELHRRGKLRSVVALETRPYNQGSRLTSFEIVEEGMPGTLICDSSAAALMRTKGTDACVVGANRVCANGDTANKIGTYSLAIVAAEHGVPFFVASPFTTLDTKVKSGDDIEIEVRPANELIETSRAPKNIECWNPAFDVTPAMYIAGIITEKGVIEQSADGTFDVEAFVKKHSGVFSDEVEEKKETELLVPDTYTEQTVDTLPLYIANHAPAAMKVLEATSFVDLDCVETGDGNINLVFIVTNSLNDKKVIVKQALPYVRRVGESWPLTLDRAWYEYKALSAEKAACPEFVPSLYYFSKPNGLIVMEYVAPPSIILRKGFIAGIRYPTMAHDMGTFCAKTLFKTSGFQLSATELRKQVEFWSKNSEMCALTEQVVFTEPYINAANNRWTSPQLDTHKKAIEADTALKVAVAKLKTKFVTRTQALLHADLHSGSVMCAPEPGKTSVIDPEFGFYGPMAFDTGSFIATMFLAYVSQGGHKNGEDYGEWILKQINVFWNTFHDEFLELWNDPMEHTGDNFPRKLFEDKDALTIAQEDYMGKLFRETLGFAGAKILRRIVGITHVEDLECIEDADIRARCEIHGLAIAKEFIKNAGRYTSIERAVCMAGDKKPVH